MITIPEAAVAVAFACAEYSKRENVVLALSSKPPAVYETSNTRARIVPAVLADPVNMAIAKDITTIPEVSHVLFDDVDGDLSVAIVLEIQSFEIRDRVFDKELSLIDAFPEINFEFTLIPAQGRTVREIDSNATQIYSRA